MRFQLLFGLAACLLTLLSSCTKKEQSPSPTSDEPAVSSTAPRVLNIYSWSNYIAPQVIAQFEKATNSKVVFNYFSSNEELLAKLQAGARGYDLIVPSGYLIKALRELDLIEPLGSLDWPELKNLARRFQKPVFDPKHEYTIPYSWGTTGIAVNRARIKDKVDSWAWVFDHPELKGQVTMLDDAPTVVGAALKYLGYSYNEERVEALAKAKALLIRQKKILKAYTPESQPVLASGEFAIAQAYSGDVLQVKNRNNPNIEYVLPKEGGEVFVDLLAIPKGAPSISLAKEFMRFTLRQDIAVSQVQHLFFSPVLNLKDAELGALSKERSVFPTEGQLSKFEMITDNPKRLEAVQQIWTELKSM
ncbi:MAG: spermidine/putrescine ABC transporter substrate-binding protein [Bdellovibrionota bacterium]